MQPQVGRKIILPEALAKSNESAVAVRWVAGEQGRQPGRCALEEFPVAGGERPDSSLSNDNATIPISLIHPPHGSHPEPSRIALIKILITVGLFQGRRLYVEMANTSIHFYRP